jgi:hypothetical protein
MTQKEAKEISLEVWRYLAEHTECFSKRDLPGELWKKLSNGCPLCVVFRVDCSCSCCPLDEAGERCPKEGSAYDRWAYADSGDTETRRKSAMRIVEVISAWKPEEVE